MLTLMVGGLMLATLVMLALQWRSTPATPTFAPPAFEKPEKKLEVSLHIEVTDCDKITTTVDTTGAIAEVSDYRRIVGFVENRGDLAVKFVRVQALWRNKDDRIIQADDIFAVGATALYPGERARFEDSTRNYLIQRCEAKIVDWWVTEDPMPQPQTSLTK